LFTVDENGKISDATIEKSAGGPFDREALRVVGLMKNWEPAKKDGLPVKSLYQLPVKFIMEQEVEDAASISDEEPDAKIVPMDAHDDYAVIFNDDERNKRLYKICSAIKTKEPALLGVIVTVKADGTYAQPEVTTNTANLNKGEIIGLLKQLPKATPARDFGKPVNSKVFIGLSNYEDVLSSLKN
jgi:TonB family protein